MRKSHSSIQDEATLKMVINETLNRGKFIGLACSLCKHNSLNVLFCFESGTLDTDISI